MVGGFFGAGMIRNNVWHALDSFPIKIPRLNDRSLTFQLAYLAFVNEIQRVFRDPNVGTANQARNFLISPKTIENSSDKNLPFRVPFAVAVISLGF